MKKLILIVFLLVGFSSFSQMKGKITYKVHLDKSSIEAPYENEENTESRNRALEMLHNAQPVASYLVFNDSISRYYAQDRDDIPQWYNDGGEISINPSPFNWTWGMAGGDNIYYSDWTRDYNISTSNIKGKKVRVIGKTLEWDITEETKEIQGYLCYKATLKNKDNRIAWFTKDIPYQHGPRGFNGLPGLILEYQDNKYFYVVQEIELNHEEAFEIEEPQEGPLISKEELIKLAGNPFGKN